MKYPSIYDLDEIMKADFFKFIKNNKNHSIFTKVSIFDKENYTNLKNEFHSKSSFSKIEKSCIGSMVGMAIGDAMGSRVEFQPLDYNYNKIKDMGDGIDGHFRLKPGQWTDDTSMGLCLADSLIENKGIFNPRDIMMRFILWWNCGYNNAFRFDYERYSKHSVGLGGNISGSFKAFLSNNGKDVYTKYGNSNTSGNGSIMRNAAIPICFSKNMEDALNFAEKQSKITHQGNEAAGCCQLLTYIIIKILNGNNLKDILNNLYKDFKCKYNSVNYLASSMQEGNNPNRNWNWKSDDFKYSVERVKHNSGYIGSYCMDGLAMALHVLYKTDSFESAILKVVNLRGDADSVGSVVGQIAGAYYGIDSIPKPWVEKINNWDNNEIGLRGYILYNLSIK